MMYAHDQWGCPTGGSENSNRKGRSTAKPGVFGPIFWPALHVMAQNYPRHATPAQVAGCTDFIAGLPFMLPCDDCGDRLSSFMGANDPASACRTRKGLVRLFVAAHDNVDLLKERRGDFDAPSPEDVARARAQFSTRRLPVRSDGLKRNAVRPLGARVPQH